MGLKILLLNPRIPYPLRDGGAIAMSQSIEEYLKMGCEVSVLAMNTSRHWVDESQLPPFYNELKYFETVYVKTNINPLAAFFNLFTDKSYNVERFINKEFRLKLIELLAKEEFDFVQFESIYVSPYLETVKEYSDANCFCRVHNIEYLIWQRLSENEPSFLKKKYLTLLTNRLKNYERTISKQFDLLLPISNIEAIFFEEEKLNDCYYLPFGITFHNILQAKEVEFDSCYHIGSMDWAPNVEGVKWLLQEVWPLLCVENKSIKLYLAGKNMPPSIQSNTLERVEVIGEVDSLVDFSLSKNIMLVPLQAGAGIRIKILEAMALGKTIVSTSIGVEGIPVQHGLHVVIADTADEFANAIQFCMSNPEASEQIGKAAKELVENKFDKSKIYATWISYYNEKIKNDRS